MIKALLLDLKTFLILLFLSLALIPLDYFKVLDLPKGAVQQITIPIQYGMYKTTGTLGKQLEFVVLSRRAAKENKALTEQLASLLSENANLRRKLAETEGFLEQQNALNPQTYDLVPARPIGVSRFLVIDKGTKDGIAPDQPVVYKDNYLGKVKEVSPNSAKIILPSDPDSKLSSFVANKDGRARGILQGQFGSEMLLDKVLHREPILEGDLVYTEGVEVNIPRGLILGKVFQILDRENEIFKQAKISSIFDVADLDIVFVITN